MMLKNLAARLLQPARLIYSMAGDLDWRIPIRRFPVYRGKELPWLTVPAVKVLESIDLSNLRIFEFGGGYSSVYFCNRGAQLTVFERDKDWGKWIKEKAEAASITDKFNLDDHRGAYDIVLVDVFNRPDHFEFATKMANPSGIIILDDSQWYPKFTASLTGYLHIPMWGTSAGRHDYKCTSFFIRNTKFEYIHQSEYGNPTHSKDDRNYINTDR